MMKTNVIALISVFFAVCSCTSNGKSDAKESSVDSDSIAAVAAVESARQDSIDAAQKAAEELAAKMPTCKQVIKIIDATWGGKIKDSSPLLTDFGFTCLVYDSYMDGEIPCNDAFYGKNAKVEAKRNADGYKEYKVVPTGKHAVVVNLSTSTDNYQCVYFSDKSDYDTFLKTIKSSDNWGPGQKENGMYVAQELH